jgi:hypothetical protein
MVIWFQLKKDKDLLKLLEILYPQVYIYKILLLRYFFSVNLSKPFEGFGSRGHKNSLDSC